MEIGCKNIPIFCWVDYRHVSDLVSIKITTSSVKYKLQLNGHAQVFKKLVSIHRVHCFWGEQQEMYWCPPTAGKLGTSSKQIGLQVRGGEIMWRYLGDHADTNERWFGPAEGTLQRRSGSSPLGWEVSTVLHKQACLWVTQPWEQCSLNHPETEPRKIPWLTTSAIGRATITVCLSASPVI